MRRSNLSLYSAAANGAVMTAQAIEAASLQPQIAPIDPLTLPVMQQAALLSMRESVVRRAVVRDLLEHAQDKPGHPDYQALADLGLCERNPGKRYHDLTTEGRTAARDLEQKLCQQFDIHLMIDAGSSGEWQQRYACPCGQWSTLVRRRLHVIEHGAGEIQQAHRIGGRHVEAVCRFEAARGSGGVMEDGKVRDEVCMLVMERFKSEIGRDVVAGSIRAAVQCMGAAACFAGLLPMKAREEIATQFADAFLDHANKRAAEIRSGKFDIHLGGQ